MKPPLKFRAFPATRRGPRDVTKLMRLTPTRRWPFARTLQLGHYPGTGFSSTLPQNIATGCPGRACGGSGMV